MKLAFYALVAIFMMPLAGISNEPDLGSRRKLPTLPIEAAIAKANEFVKENKINIERNFLAGVQYHETGAGTEPNKTEKTSGPYWQITYEPDFPADGGQVFIMVYMDGKARYFGGL